MWAKGGSVDSQPGRKQVGVGESTSRSARGAREENLGGGSRQPAAGMSEQFHNFEKSALRPPEKGFCLARLAGQRAELPRALNSILGALRHLRCTPRLK